MCILRQGGWIWITDRGLLVLAPNYPPQIERVPCQGQNRRTVVRTNPTHNETAPSLDSFSYVRQAPTRSPCLQELAQSCALAIILAVCCCLVKK